MDPQLLAIRQARRDKFLAQKEAAEGIGGGEVATDTSTSSSGEPTKRKISSVLEGLSPAMMNAPISALLADAPLPEPKRVRADPDVVRVPPERTAEIRKFLAEPISDLDGVPIISWNIDGLDQIGGPQALMLRSLHAALEIARHRPAVVLLQEAVPPALELLSAPQVLGGTYEFLTPANPPQPYYVAILVDKKRAKKLANREVNFPTSKMGRQLLAVTLEFPGHPGPPLLVSTAHLESTKDQAPERKKQLTRCMKFLHEAIKMSGPAAALLAGDLNLRDEEVRAVQKELQADAAGIADAWSFCGSPENARWTWDTVANDNVAASYTCKTRFDRIFFLSPGISDNAAVVPVAKGNKAKAKAKAHDQASLTPPASTKEGWRPTKFQLVGQERVPGLGRFPSDHWGLLTSWSHAKANQRVAIATGTAEASSQKTPAEARGPVPSDDADDDDDDLKAAIALSLGQPSHKCSKEQPADKQPSWQSLDGAGDVIDLD